MKKNTLTSISLVCLITTSGYATDIPAGPVSGDWYSSGNPYNINGEIYVHEDSTLNIHEGVDVIFQGHHKFIVNGFLEAIGTETDSILFTAADTGEGWHAIRFIDAPDSSHLSYCIVQYGYATGSTYEDSTGGGIRCNNSNPVINRCAIRWNSGYHSCGGIGLFNYSDPNISYCTIVENSGGGIGFADHSDPIISNCIINGNDGAGIGYGNNCDPIISYCTINENDGHGIGFNTACEPIISHCDISGNLGSGISFITDCVVNISNCTINENSADSWGGGISFGYDCIVTIDHCLISGNSASTGIGGISIGMYSEAYISNCTISNNHSDAYGGGIGCMIGVSVEIKNSIVEGNTGSGGIFFYSSAEAEVDYSDFHNNEPEHFTGDNIPENLGVINSTNANGDPCDQYHNIFLDPLFYSTTGDSAFYLTDDSPCIDAGYPFSPPDPDGSTADIGAYWSGYAGVIDERPLNSPLEYVLLDVYPNPFNSSTVVSYELRAASYMKLAVYDIAGREVIVLAEGYSKAGSYQEQFDGSDLASGIYFASLRVGSSNIVKKLVLLK